MQYRGVAFSVVGLLCLVCIPSKSLADLDLTEASRLRLGVARTASVEEILAAYEKEILQVDSSNRSATEKTRARYQLNQAFQLLSRHSNFSGKPLPWLVGPGDSMKTRLEKFNEQLIALGGTPCHLNPDRAITSKDLDNAIEEHFIAAVRDKLTREFQAIGYPEFLASGFAHGELDHYRYQLILTARQRAIQSGIVPLEVFLEWVTTKRHRNLAYDIELFATTQGFFDFSPERSAVIDFLSEAANAGNVSRDWAEYAERQKRIHTGCPVELAKLGLKGAA